MFAKRSFAFVCIVFSIFKYFHDMKVADGLSFCVFFPQQMIFDAKKCYFLILNNFLQYRPVLNLFLGNAVIFFANLPS